MCQRDTKRAIELITKRGTTPTEMTKIADTFSKSPMLKRLFKSQSISEHNHQHLPLFLLHLSPFGDHDYFFLGRKPR